MKPIYFSLIFFVAACCHAQSCSITLLSESDQYYNCSEMLEPMTPLIFQVDATGYTITGLPPGVMSDYENEILTISGTPTQPGFWNYQILAQGGCTKSGTIGISIATEMNFQCTSATQNSITVAWPGISGDYVGDLNILYSYGDVNEFIFFFMPEEGPFTIQNLPPGTDVHFIAWLDNGIPLCFAGSDQITCTTASLGLDESTLHPTLLFPNPVQDILNISAQEKIDEVVIYDLQGREVMRKNIGNAQVPINVSALAKSTYVVRIKSGENELIRRIIKD